jgi:hypothetical protein
MRGAADEPCPVAPVDTAPSEENRMAAQIVIGVFPSRGIAEDACHRLHTEGVPNTDIALHMLRETAPVPQNVKAELAALEIDPLFLGNIRDGYVQYIHNGETVVFVRAASEADVTFAADILRLFEPVVVDVRSPADQTAPAARNRATSPGE